MKNIPKKIKPRSTYTNQDWPRLSSHLHWVDPWWRPCGPPCCHQEQQWLRPWYASLATLCQVCYPLLLFLWFSYFWKCTSQPFDVAWFLYKHETQDRLRVHITDAEKQRWEVPYSILPREQPPSLKQTIGRSRKSPIIVSEYSSSELFLPTPQTHLGSLWRENQMGKPSSIQAQINQTNLAIWCLKTKIQERFQKKNEEIERI